MSLHRPLLRASVVASVIVGLVHCSPSDGNARSRVAPTTDVQAVDRASDDGLDGTREGDARGWERAFVRELESAGFIVQEGHATRADPVSAVDGHEIDSAAGFNYPQYYKRFVVPLHPALGGGVDARQTEFKLAADEAIVYAGFTPPLADYFSFCPMLWARYPGARVVLTGDWVFASLRDPLNHLRLHTQGEGNPFHKRTVVIFTADEGVHDRIAASARAAGYPASILNSYPLPAQDLRMGIGDDADSLFILLRTANFVSQAEGDRYVLDDGWARVYRITPRVPPTPRPFPSPGWRDRSFTKEADLVPGLEAALERLERAILARMAPDVDSARPFRSIRWFPDSKDVLADVPGTPAYRAFVAGESSDTPYFRTAEEGARANFLLGDDDMVVAYGVNHAATGVAIYSSATVYGEWVNYPCPTDSTTPLYANGCGDPVWNGVASMTSHAFTGSAEEYLPRDPMARYLYAVRFVRENRANRKDPWRVVVPGYRPNPYLPFSAQPSATGIPDERAAFVGYRAYVNPVTRSGPSHEDLVPDRAILFRMRP